MYGVGQPTEAGFAQLAEKIPKEPPSAFSNLKFSLSQSQKGEGAKFLKFVLLEFYWLLIF